MLEPIKAVVFDLDGTLVSSSLDFAAIRRDISCPLQSDILEYIDGLESSVKAEALEIVHQHEMQDARSVKVMARVPELLAQLKSWGLHTGIVTRNSRRVTDLKLQSVCLQVDKVLTRECAPAKPHPGALLQLCTEWQLQPAEVIYVGDYLYDLQTASNAKAHSCLYVSGQEPEYAHLAGFVCHSFENFVAQLKEYLSSCP